MVAGGGGAAQGRAGRGDKRWEAVVEEGMSIWNPLSTVSTGGRAQPANPVAMLLLSTGFLGKNVGLALEERRRWRCRPGQRAGQQADGVRCQRMTASVLGGGRDGPGPEPEGTGRDGTRRINSPLLPLSAAKFGCGLWLDQIIRLHNDASPLQSWKNIKTRL
jgi:hypothetical protein